MPGRNDPCHCGSGRKYKKCCLDGDQGAEREQRRFYAPRGISHADLVAALDKRDGPAIRKTKSRRVILQQLPGRNRFGSSDGTQGSGNTDAWQRSLSRGHHSAFKVHPVARLTEDGVDFGTEPGPGDEVAYAMDPYRSDNCFQAAIATVTQVGIEQVPDLQIDRRLKRGHDPKEISRDSWERIDRWAAKRGLEGHFWEEVPVPRRRWIGVIVADRELLGYDPGEESFEDHGLIMSHDRLIFDPSCSITPPPGMRPANYVPDRITYGISFEPKEE